MQDLIPVIQVGLVVLETLVACLFLFLGLYTITRDLPLRKDRSNVHNRPGLWAGVAMALASCFFLGVAVQTTILDKNRYILWNKLTWWVVPFAIACWYWVVRLFVLDANGDSDMPLKKQVKQLILLFSGAAAMSGVGVFTEIIFDFSGTKDGRPPFESFYIPVNLPGHYIYDVYLVGGLLVCAYHLRRLSQQSKTESRQQRAFSQLCWGTVVMAIGAAVAVGAYAHLHRAPEQLGDLIVAGGLWQVGIGITRYNAILKNQVIREDLKRTVVEVLIVAMIYLFVVGGVMRSFGMDTVPATLYAPPLIYLVVLTHMPLRAVGWFFDWLILRDWRVEFRFELREFVRETLTAREKVQALRRMRKKFLRVTGEAQLALVQEELSVIFYDKNFHDEGLMAGSDLHGLLLVQQEWERLRKEEEKLLREILTTRELATLLQTFLERFIKEKFCPGPMEERPSTPTGKWIECLLLVEYYIGDDGGTPARYFYSRWGISETEFYRQRESALQELAKMMAEEEEILTIEAEGNSQLPKPD